MGSSTQYPIASVGRGRKTHLLDPNGRVRCENHMSETGDGMSGPYLRQDAHGQYRDLGLVSEVHPLGVADSFSCYWCNRWADEDAAT